MLCAFGHTKHTIRVANRMCHFCTAPPEATGCSRRTRSRPRRRAPRAPLLDAGVRGAGAAGPCDGCVDGDADIMYADGTARAAHKVRAGDVVVSLAGPAMVLAVFKTVNWTGPLVRVTVAAPGGGAFTLECTPTHPVAVDGRWMHAWRTPGATAAAHAGARVLVSILLARGQDGRVPPAVLASGVWAITLGHGLADDVAAHPVFGDYELMASHGPGVFVAGAGLAPPTHPFWTRARAIQVKQEPVWEAAREEMAMGQ